ncbi:helix-turn-helix transcriptional regulator [Bradyrhizobium sp. BRP22]|uniref:helix-turn-helix domain-containing protein n=1 Tax=Bradyrhizobium sp. BRP22 TaxID=2793821 RepID=UPI001CD49B53|nr:helix-turn-helix domain-containing protein [Bradyrhizobium sp. BRP22]MCA1455905.1 helix-turn-helix transcriptional regulator [Bradyrhizobium sp. BRP22]
MAKVGPGHNSGTLWLRRTWREIDRDPECDRFKDLRQKERIKDADLAVLAGLAGSTVKNMFGGKTRRPQHATFAKMASALGYKYDLVRDEKPDYAAEIPKARAEYRAYRATLGKRKAKAKAKARTNGHGRSK